MKKVLTILGKIALVLILVSVLTGLFMPKYVHENQDGRITGEFYREKLDTDIIFAGSSVAYSGISPVTLWKDYGITSFIRGNSSQTMWQSYYMLEDAIKVHKPKLAVVDVGFMRNGDDYAEEPANRKALDGMRWSGSKWDCIKASMYEEEKMIDYVFPIFRFHSRWKDLNGDDFKYLFYTGYVTHNGQLIDMNGPDEDFTIAKEYLNERGNEIGPKNEEYLVKLIELCQSNDVQLMLMRVPRCTVNWTDDNDALIQKISDENNITYINYDKLADEIGIDFYTMTPDSGEHLNTLGAEVFSDYLGDYLITHYDIPRHDDDEAYVKVWSRKMERYEREKNEYGN